MDGEQPSPGHLGSQSETDGAATQPTSTRTTGSLQVIKDAQLLPRVRPEGTMMPPATALQVTLVDELQMFSQRTGGLNTTHDHLLAYDGGSNVIDIHFGPVTSSTDRFLSSSTSPQSTALFTAQQLLHQHPAGVPVLIRGALVRSDPLPIDDDTNPLKRSSDFVTARHNLDTQRMRNSFSSVELYLEATPDTVITPITAPNSTWTFDPTLPEYFNVGSIFKKRDEYVHLAADIDCLGIDDIPPGWPDFMNATTASSSSSTTHRPPDIKINCLVKAAGDNQWHAPAQVPLDSMPPTSAQHGESSMVCMLRCFPSIWCCQMGVIH